MDGVNSEQVPAPNIEGPQAVSDAVLLVALVGGGLCSLSSASALAAVAVIVLTWQPPVVEVAEHTCPSDHAVTLTMQWDSERHTLEFRDASDFERAVNNGTTDRVRQFGSNFVSTER